MSVLLIYVLIISAAGLKKSRTRSPIKEIYSSEGVMGQVKVYDMPFNTYSRGMKKGRALMVNNTLQTIGDRSNLKRDLWDYSYFFPSAVSTFPEGSDLLLLGLGGGSLLHHFDRLGFDTDIVELDDRIKDVAIKYFGVDPDNNIIVDDARSYLNSCDKKYDIVVMDLFFNETPPAHVLTVESFNRVKKILREEGLLMMNFYGFINGEEGLAARSILKTLKYIDFKVEILPTPGAEENRNLIFLAGDELPNFNDNDYKLPDLPLIDNIEARFIDQSNIDLTNASILRDNKPELEKMYLPAALKWRNTSIEYNLKKFLKDDVL